MKSMIVVRIDRCLGCKSCEIACVVAHSSAKELIAAVRSGERASSRMAVMACRNRAVPIHCNHCEDAVCVLICPTGAIYRQSPNGPVLVDAKRCIGCRMCIQACPFGVITMNAAGKGVLKCDLCVERLEQGQEPACIVSCPTRALVFGDEETASRTKRQKAAEQMVAGRQGQEKASGQ